MKSSKESFNTLKDTQKWFEDVAKSLRPGDLILLSGPMGAGKTQVVRWIVAALGGESASSPTFAIHQTYSTARFGIDHLDLYRLESPADFESAGLWDILEAKDGVTLVEWADKIPRDWWPSMRRRIEIQMTPGTNEQRLIAVEIVQATSN